MACSQRCAPSSKKATMNAMGNIPQRQLSHRVKGSRVSQIIMKREVCLQAEKGEGAGGAFINWCSAP